VLARDWNEFLQVQEQLLFGVTETVERSGTTLALPSQTMYLAGPGEEAAGSGAASKVATLTRSAR
jgi:hypothetical protein